MFQMGGLGPMMGQTPPVRMQPGPKTLGPRALCRRDAATYGVLDHRTRAREYIAGEYSIADIACWPWIITYKRQQVDLERFPNVKRWYVAIAKRPATQKGYKVPKDVGEIPMP